jgi:hypothetical protein
MPKVPEVSAAAIVLLGKFNPQMFQPSWFARQELISTSDADEATVDIIHPDICQFQTEKFVLQVSQDKFSAVTKANTTPALLRDFVNGTFLILEHTPVSGIGINRQMHFKVESEQTWHRIGDALAPKVGWQQHLRGRVGLETLEISSVDPDDKFHKIRVVVQPSQRVHPGVFFEFNDHRTVAETVELPNALQTCLRILREHWEISQDASLITAADILHWAETRD